MGTPIRIEDVKAVSSPEGIQQFFARLDYDVGSPADQTAAGLGVAERVHHMLRQARRLTALAMGPGQPAGLEAYWIEATNLTADLRKTVVNAFRNKPANTLLLMTTRDFTTLDFVLIEKVARPGSLSGPSVAHRLLSVDRRNPSEIHLRVLERMRNRGADPYAQYDRIRDAFKVAEWSELDFNNRNLFSDYFLKHRLTIKELFPAWHADVRPQLRDLQGVFQNAGSISNLSPADYHAKFILPLLQLLEFTVTVDGKDDGSADYVLRAKASNQNTPPLAALLVYPWDRPLDRKDDQDRERAEDIPGIRVVRVLETQKLNWAILTNGKDWRLYCAQAHSRASNYYEIDLPGMLERDDLIAFRYFHFFFRADAFKTDAAFARSTAEPLCFLDRLRQGSADFAKEVGERLRGQIFDRVFPYLAQGFVDYRKEKHGETTKAGDPFLNEVYDATLTLLYRLLFLLYAESLDLVPVNEPAYAAASLRRLKEEIKAAGGGDGDAVEDRLKTRYDRSDTKLYRRICELFEVIDGSDNELGRKYNVPAYNGGLFRTKPPVADKSREASAARFLNKHRVPDFYLARALDLLARDEDTKTHKLVFVDYKALGVRQLGSIYEGLLMYHVVVPTDDWEKGFQRMGLKVALVPSNKERKKLGSYFTPQHIVKYIVAHTVGPLLTEKFDAIAPKMREFQRDLREKLEYEKASAERKRITPRGDEEILKDLLFGHPKPYSEVVWELFDIKVLDPAMGSGHFLVETVDFITDKVLDFLAGFPWNPVHVLIDQRIRRLILESLDTQGVKINEDRLTDVNLIKRLVMKRCVYGVDLNAMAVELAKVSLWLDSFTLGAPLSFLDHHLKCGNSLIGSSIAELKKLAEGWMYGIPMEPLERATRNMEDIAHRTDATLVEVQKSADTYRQVLSGVEGYRALLDCLTAEYFGVSGATHLITDGGELIDLATGHLDESKLTPRDRRLVQEAVDAGAKRNFFHWDVDFPDVFFTSRREPSQRAFDALVGNPPYIAVDSVPKCDRTFYPSKFKCLLRKYDLMACFLWRGVELLRENAMWGLIIPQVWQTGENYTRLRSMLLGDESVLARIINLPFDVFPDAYVDTCVTVLARRAPNDSDSYDCVGKHFPKEAHVNDLSCVTHTTFVIHVPSMREGAVLALFDELPTLARAKSSGKIRKLGDIADCTQGPVESFLTLIRRSNAPAGTVPYAVPDVQRYELTIDDRSWAKGFPADSFNKFYAVERVLARRILNRQDRLVCALATDPFVCKKDFNPIVSLDPSISAALLLGLLNSSMYSFLYTSKSRLALKDDFRQTTLAELKRLPFPADKSMGRAGQLAEQALLLGRHGELLKALGDGLVSKISEAVQANGIAKWTGASVLSTVDYLGWDGRFPTWHPDSVTAVDGRWFPNGVAPPITGDGPGNIPWDLIARVYPSYLLPGIDTVAWEAAAWEEFCDLLRKNKSKIGNARIRADLTGRGAITNPTGPMRKLQEMFLKYHREIREDRAKAAEIDFLIDRIVFWLFDLTLDEQKIILSKVGPGRPLPTRRGKRKKNVQPNTGSGPSLFDA